MEKKGLWMPAGSVRALLALMLVSTVCFVVIYPVITVAEIKIPGEITATVSTLAGVVVAHYFKSRETEEKGDGGSVS
jgi:hypothetical protein